MHLHLLCSLTGTILLTGFTERIYRTADTEAVCLSKGLFSSMTVPCRWLISLRSIWAQGPHCSLVLSFDLARASGCSAMNNWTVDEVAFTRRGCLFPPFTHSQIRQNMKVGFDWLCPYVSSLSMCVHKQSWAKADAKYNSSRCTWTNCSSPN